jgi:hypothetical protein
MAEEASSVDCVTALCTKSVVVTQHELGHNLYEQDVVIKDDVGCQLYDERVQDNQLYGDEDDVTILDDDGCKLLPDDERVEDDQLYGDEDDVTILDDDGCKLLPDDERVEDDQLYGDEDVTILDDGCKLLSDDERVEDNQQLYGDGDVTILDDDADEKDAGRVCGQKRCLSSSPLAVVKSITHNSKRICREDYDSSK